MKLNIRSEIRVAQSAQLRGTSRLTSCAASHRVTEKSVTAKMMYTGRILRRPTKRAVINMPMSAGRYESKIMPMVFLVTIIPESTKRYTVKSDLHIV